MRLFRLCRQKYAELTGYGAKRTGGRWNRKGISALYTAEHASLTVIEVLVHLDRTEIPSDFVLLEINVADEHILTLPIAQTSEEFLTKVYQTGAEALPPNIVGFSVPSVVVPQDRVIVLYSDAPLHASVVRAIAITPFAFDPRLFTAPAG
jgi:RES domain-containing protein